MKPTCQQYFCQPDATAEEIARGIEKDYPDFACEKQVCSPYSPGPVTDDEYIAFLLIDPLHYDSERQTVVPDAFQELGRRDLSTVRSRYATRQMVNQVRDELIARGKPAIGNTGRAVDEVCLAMVSALRSAFVGKDRIMGVFDTAQEFNIAHASVLSASPVFSNRVLRKQLRNRVHAAFATNRMKLGSYLEQLPNDKDNPVAH